MKLLLDTHALIWLFNGDQRLSLLARNAILSTGTTNWVSAVSLWEIAIKLGLGKLRLGADAFSQLIARIDADGVSLLGVAPAHCARVAAMPLHHRDPFDRMLVAQAQEERLAIVSGDAALDAYGVERVW